MKKVTKLAIVGALGLFFFGCYGSHVKLKMDKEANGDYVAGIVIEENCECDEEQELNVIAKSVPPLVDEFVIESKEAELEEVEELAAETLEETKELSGEVLESSADGVSVKTKKTLADIDPYAFGVKYSMYEGPTYKIIKVSSGILGAYPPGGAFDTTRDILRPSSEVPTPASC
jgi:hypothetical protein